MSESNKNFGKRSADEEHSDAPVSSQARLDGSWSISSRPNNANEVFNLNLKFECSPAVSLMSPVMLEKVNSAVNKTAMKAAMRELRKQIKTVYKPWSSKSEEQKKIQIDNENYDAFKFRLENDDYEYNDYLSFKTEKSHDTRHYFHKQAVDQLGLDPLKPDGESDVHTLTKDECRMIFEAIQNESDLKDEMGKYLEKKSALTRSFEILVNLDPFDKNGTRIQWPDVTPGDNNKCNNCGMWGEGDLCECETVNSRKQRRRRGGSIWDSYWGPCEDCSVYFSDEPINYRNGIIMKLQSLSDVEGNVIQVKYVKNPESHYFCYSWY